MSWRSQRKACRCGNLSHDTRRLFSACGLRARQCEHSLFIHVRTFGADPHCAPRTAGPHARPRQCECTFTHILQAYFFGTGDGHTIPLVSGKQHWKISVNVSKKFTRTDDTTNYSHILWTILHVAPFSFPAACNSVLFWVNRLCSTHIFMIIKWHKRKEMIRKPTCESV